jgi:hypothetical protein
MEPIKPDEDFLFKYYQKFKATKIVELSLKNMFETSTKPTIIDETMIELK